MPPASASAGAAKPGEERLARPREGPEEAEVDEELREEAVQGRQGRDGRAPDREGGARLRHLLQQAAHEVHLPRPRPVDHRPGTQEEERLEEGVEEDVQERPAEAERDPLRPRRGPPEEGDADSRRDDPDVLDARVGEEALEVVLPRGERGPVERRRRPEDEEEPAPPRGRRAVERRDAQDAVEAHLEHDARHHRRDVARRPGVRAREPEVEREEPRLGAEADEGEEEDDARRAGDREARRRAPPTRRSRSWPGGAPSSRRARASRRASRRGRSTPPPAPPAGGPRSSRRRRRRAPSPPTRRGRRRRCGRRGRPPSTPRGGP